MAKVRQKQRQTNTTWFLEAPFVRMLRMRSASLKIFQKTILSLKFKFPANNTLLLLAGLQDSFLEYFLFEIWRSEKISSHFLKKATFKKRQILSFKSKVLKSSFLTYSVTPDFFFLIFTCAATYNVSRHI